MASNSTPDGDAVASIESLSIRVAQAGSTANLIGRACGRDAHVQNALGLLAEYLGQCADDLSELHRRLGLDQN